MITPLPAFRNRALSNRRLSLLLMAAVVAAWFVLPRWTTEARAMPGISTFVRLGWGTYLTLYVVFALYLSHYRSFRGIHVDLRNLPIWASLLTFGPGPTLFLLVVGAVLSETVRYLARSRLPGEPDGRSGSWRQAFVYALYEIATRGLAILVAVAVFILINGQLPRDTLHLDNLLALMVAFTVYYVVREALWLTHWRAIQLADLSRRFTTKAVILPLALILSMGFYTFSELAFFMLVTSYILSVAFLLPIKKAQSVLEQRVEHLATVDETSQTLLAPESLNVLLDETQRLADNLLLINNVASTINASLDLGAILETVCQAAIEVSNADTSAIFFWDVVPRRMTLAHGINVSEDLNLAFQAFQDTTWSHWDDFLGNPQSIAIADIEIELDPEIARPVIALTRARAVVVIPLISRNELIGILSIGHKQRHEHSTNELNLLDTLANQASVAIETTRLFQETQSAVERLGYLAEATRSITSSLELDTVVEAVLRWSLGGMDIDTVALYMWKRAQGRLVLQAHSHRQDAAQDLPPPVSAYPLAEFRELQDLLYYHWSRVVAANEPDLSPQFRQLFAEVPCRTLAFVPLVQQDQAMGVLMLGVTGEQTISARDIDLAEAIANQVATALQNAHLHNLTESALSDRVLELSAIEDILQRISADINLPTVIEDVLQAARTVIPADLFECVLLEEPASDLVSTWRLKDKATVAHWRTESLSQLGVIKRVITTRQATSVADVSQGTDYVMFEAPHTYRSELCVPIISENNALGALNVESLRLNSFDEYHLRFLQNLASHAAIAIERARLFESRERQIEILNTLRAFSLELLTNPDMATLLSAICACAMQIVQADNVHVYFYNEATQDLSFAASLWQDGRHDIEAMTPRPEGNTRQAALSGQSLISTDLPPIPDAANKIIIYIPIKHTGSVIGVLNAAAPEQDALGESEMQALELLTNQAAVAIQSVRLYEAVRTGHDRMRTILNTVRDGLILIDAQGLLMEVNPAAESFAGFDLRPYIGETYNHLLQAVTDIGRPGLAYNKEDWHRLISQLADDPYQVIERRSEIEIDIDGETHYLNEHSTPVLDETGKTDGRLFVFRDVTEIRQLEQGRLELTHMVVHDLKNPLSTVRLALDMINDFGYDPTKDEDEDLTEAIQTAIDSSTKLFDMIQSILDIARMESGKMVLKRKQVVLNELVQVGIERQFVIARSAHISISSELPKDLPDVWVDLELISRVLANLISNALRFAPKNGRVMVQAEHQPGEDVAIISIVDNGPGVPEDKRETIFERYMTGTVKEAQSGNRASGTGLGLAFCRLAVEEHGGRIWTEDSPSGGAAFRFTLPLASESCMIQETTPDESQDAQSEAGASELEGNGPPTP